MTDDLGLTPDARLRFEIFRTVMHFGASDDPVGLAKKGYEFVKGDAVAIEHEPGFLSSQPRLPAPSKLREGDRAVFDYIAREQEERRVKAAVIAINLKVSYPTVLNRLNKLIRIGLVERIGGKGRNVHYRITGQSAPEEPPKETAPAKRRFTNHAPMEPEFVDALADDHEAVNEGRTMFPTTVVDVKDSPRVLVSGVNSRKIGSPVAKGPWAGFPIFTLTLEERKTCPASCFHWRTCYGNAMPRARRHRHGPEFEARLAFELAEKQREHPDGFVVRLHILGDFYSVDYVVRWSEWLDEFPALHVFGYTAHKPVTNIGYQIEKLTNARWDRFAIRFSDETSRPGGATTIWRKPETAVVPEGIVCPAQTGATDCCGTCGLCWHENAADKTIVFVAHGKKAPRKIEREQRAPRVVSRPVRLPPVKPDREAELAAIEEFEKAHGVTKFQPGESAFPPDQDCFSAPWTERNRRRRAVAE